LAFREDNQGRTDAGTSGFDGLMLTASGEHDDAYRRVARRLVEAGYGDAVIRLGHEFNGAWAPWSAVGVEQAFIAAWQHVHGVFRAESADFQFDWTGMRARWQQTAPPAYPGDDYVDYVGMDLYWRAKGSDKWDEGRWQRDFAVNLVAQRDFAIQHGKQTSYPEWGLLGGDVPEFIDAMHAWLGSLPAEGPGSVAYHAYFDGGGDHALDRYPNAEERFLRLFGDPSR
jgi:hypothetical protein